MCKCFYALITHNFLSFSLSRLVDLLQRTKGEKVFGGKTDLQDNYIELTIVKDVKGDDALMEEEVFSHCLIFPQFFA